MTDRIYLIKYFIYLLLTYFEMTIHLHLGYIKLGIDAARPELVSGPSDRSSSSSKGQIAVLGIRSL